MTRLALLVLRDNDSQLAKRFCQSDEVALAATEMADQLREDTEFLKNGIKIL